MNGPSGGVSQRDGSRFELGPVLTPSARYRPAPFWSWNETIEVPEVRRQMREFARSGAGGIFPHARAGLQTPYMGARYRTALTAVCDAAREHGLLVYLYDEDRWPSGWASGVVPLRDPAFRLQWVRRIPSGLTPPVGGEPALLAEGRAGVRFYRFSSPVGQKGFNGATYSDLMSEPAVQAFLEAAYDPLAALLGAEFGQLIPAIFTDEPALTAPLPDEGVPPGTLFWTTDLPERFRALHGYDLLPRLEQLFEDVGDYQATRTDYYRTCAALFEQRYSAQIGAWCRRHGVASTGHYMYEDPLAGALAWGAAILPHYRHLDWPGVDHLGRQVREVITALGCRSVVNQYGKARMMTELYGGAGQHLSFEDRKWLAEQQIVLGANFLVPHLAHYTMAGARKRDYPCNLFYQQPWWPLNRVVDDYLARLCALMSQGVTETDLLIIHPQESLYPLRRPARADQGPWDFAPPEDSIRLDTVDGAFHALSHDLLGMQRAFDYGDETILAEEGRVDTSGPRPLLRVGQAAYALVILPALTSLRASTLDLLAAFAAAGGPILSTGMVPSLIDGRPDSAGRLSHFLREAVQPVQRSNLEATLGALLPPRLRVEVVGPRRWLWQQARREGDTLVVFLVNLSRQEAVTGWLHLRGMSAPYHVLDLAGGSYRPAGGDGAGSMPLHLEPGQSLVLIAGTVDLDPFVRAPAAPPPAGTPQVLDGWQLERLDANALPLDCAAYRCGTAAWSCPLPVIAIQALLDQEQYEGPLTLRYVFNSVLELGSDAARGVSLVVEYADQCDIAVNGQRVAYGGAPHWHDVRWLPVDIRAAIVAGENVVEIHYPDFRYWGPRHVTTEEGASLTREGGTEIEAVYVVGDFSVAAQSAGDLGTATRLPQPAWAMLAAPEPTPTWDLRAVAGPFALTASAGLSTGDLTEQGLPFFAGRVRCLAQIALAPLSGQRTWLEVEQLTVPVAEVRVNGHLAGTLAWRPYRVEVTDYLTAGDNTIEIILYHSLRNLLGPHHDAYGERYRVGPESFAPEYADWPRRMKEGGEAAGWRSSYAVTPFGLLGAVFLSHGV